MIVECSIVAVAATLPFVLFIRKRDLALPEPTSPTAHLDERKSAIHESLRDLQFDFRTGKLSQADYQASKLSLQTELAAVLLQIRNAQRNMKCVLIAVLMCGIGSLAAASEDIRQERQPTRGPARIHERLPSLLGLTCLVLVIGGARLYRKGA